MNEIIKLGNNNCTKCQFKQLEIVAFNTNTIIKSCTRCKEN
jgi:hypothetical protein